VHSLLTAGFFAVKSPLFTGTRQESRVTLPSGTLPHGWKCFFRSSPVMPASLILSSGQPEAGMSPPGSALRPCPFLPDRKAMISGPQAAGRYGADVTWITLPGKRQMNPAVLPAEVLILGVWGSTGQRGDSSRT